jgi:predicted outer membrane repeat protein
MDSFTETCRTSVPVCLRVQREPAPSEVEEALRDFVGSVVMNRETTGSGRIVWMAVTVVLFTVCSAWGKAIYVDDDAPAPGDGTSWATAYRFLQDALADAAAAEKPVEIRVAQGLYTPDRSATNPAGAGGSPWDHYFHLLDSTSFLGGYTGLGAGDPNARDTKAHESVLSGDLAGNDAELTDPALLRTDATRDDNTREVLRISGSHVRLEGCTITGGSGGGVEVLGSDVVISDCFFYANRGDEGDARMSAGALTGYGDGMLMVRCSFIGNAGDKGAARADYESFEDCQFIGNYSWGLGGGAVWQSGGTFTDCVFADNRAKEHGGALYLHHAGGTLTRCVFRRNRAEGWGGAVLCEGDMSMTGCLLLGNMAGGGGGAYVHSRGEATITNCLFAGNQAAESGGACFAGWKSMLTVVNCAMTANRSAKGAFLGVDYNTEGTQQRTIVSNCILSNGAEEIWTNAVPVEVSYTCATQGVTRLSDPNGWVALGPGNIEGDPLISDPGYWDPNDDFFVGGDYHLKSQAGRWDEASGSWVLDDVTSPCIDAGDPNSPIMYEPFPNGGVVNMGAYGGTAQASKSYFGWPLCETVIAGDINGDCRVDIADVIILLDHWLETGDRADE